MKNFKLVFPKNAKIRYRFHDNRDSNSNKKRKDTGSPSGMSSRITLKILELMTQAGGQVRVGGNKCIYSCMRATLDPRPLHGQ